VCKRSAGEFAKRLRYFVAMTQKNKRFDAASKKRDECQMGRKPRPYWFSGRLQAVSRSKCGMAE